MNEPQPRANPKGKLFNVVCRWQSAWTEPWNNVLVIVRHTDGYYTAATDACLFLINSTGGNAYPFVVIEWPDLLHVMNSPCLDAEDFEGCELEGGEVLACIPIA